MAFVIIAILSYLIGSIPFGVLLARAFQLPDPRTIGSGNIGATNMLRTGNKKVALLTLLLDAGKGAAAVLLTRSFLSYLTAQTGAVEVMQHCYAIIDGQRTSASCPSVYDPQAVFAALALTAAALGHMVSPWLKFNGGKGVATLLGGAWAFSWATGLLACMLWLAVFLLRRYVSLASIITLAMLPVITYWYVDIESALTVAVSCAYAIYKHRSNIVRLYRDEEPVMGNKA